MYLTAAQSRGQETSFLAGTGSTVLVVRLPTLHGPPELFRHGILLDPLLISMAFPSTGPH